ncbi:hypothetical protein [Paenarthrobacter nitroguajacolicus]|uniref:hypothetical protein n=1 Tax=Paenarthrobacter nitroguajacolicus TaxID=211146 RepID=UPI00248AFB0C|nr:hypothetical protein [Paenarthrobacter nitroguajacolicus]
MSGNARNSDLAEAGQLVTGYGTALGVAAGLLLAGGVLALATLPARTISESETKTTMTPGVEAEH